MTGNSTNAFFNPTPRPQEQLAFTVAKVDKRQEQITAWRDNSKRKGQGSTQKAKSVYAIRKECERASTPQNEALSSDLQNSQVDSSAPEQSDTIISLYEGSYLGCPLPSNSFSHLTNFQQGTINENNLSESTINLHSQSNTQNNEVNQYRANRGHRGISKNDREITDYVIEIFRDRCFELNYDGIMLLTLTIPTKYKDGTDLTDECYLNLRLKEANIIESFYRKLPNFLKKHGLNEKVFIKKELQTERYFEYNQLTTHYHIIFLWNWLEKNSFKVAEKKLKEMWEETLYRSRKIKSDKRVPDTEKAIHCRFKKKEGKKGENDRNENEISKWLAKYLCKSSDDNSGLIESIQNTSLADTLPKRWIVIPDEIMDEVNIRKENDVVKYDIGVTSLEQFERTILNYPDVFRTPYRVYTKSYPHYFVALKVTIKKGKVKEAQEILDSNFNRSSEDTSEYTSKKIELYSRIWEIELEENNENPYMGLSLPCWSDENKLIILKSSILKILKIIALSPFKGQSVCLNYLVNLHRKLSCFDYAFHYSALVPLLPEYQNLYFQ